jgi:restriction system-associated AAA family ATPase
MRLLRVHIISAETCGGLLDGLNLRLRVPSEEYTGLDPLCLVGPNGTGKSQFLQVIAEIFQSLFHACVSGEERVEGNSDLQFEIEYLIRPDRHSKPVHIRASRKSTRKRKVAVQVQRKDNGEWSICDLNRVSTISFLPSRILGYTSGDNETLSLPFLISRSGYADEVASVALSNKTDREVPDTRLMLMDYGTHLEVLIANHLLGGVKERELLLQDANLRELHSFRCIVQLAHTAAPKIPKKMAAFKTRKGVQLTEELEICIENLKNCSTCYNYDAKTETYVFDFWINSQLRKAFNFFWENSITLYSAFHKLSMLNDLAIPKKARTRFKQDTKKRRFSSKLPEPQVEDKVFRFERVRFSALLSKDAVDYVSLSDGEHQLGQILGTFCMIEGPNVIFLLDEPESHFNPQWRVKFVSRLLKLHAEKGDEINDISQDQECLLSTHAPFVASDMSRNKVFIFRKEGGKVSVANPDIETYGSTFDTILEECFDVRPPISKVSLDEINRLMKSEDISEIESAMERFGHSVEKAFLSDRLRELKKDGDS